MTHRRAWGRFTVRGSATVEAEITRTVERIRDRCRALMSPVEYRTLALIGGYGRGEGGVERRGGAEVPHNNLDVLIVSRWGVDRDGLRHRVTAGLASLAEAAGLGIDVGVVSERALRSGRRLVMWHDMSNGHKVLGGDPAFIRDLPQRTRTPDVLDVRDLMINRGTLLLLNRKILAHEGPLPVELERRVVRHIQKAMIGYGDALLFLHGRYHYSYVEKQARLRRLSGVSRPLIERIDRALEFRFQPVYEAMAKEDLARLNDEAMRSVETVHRAFEARRLARAMVGWDDYAALAARAGRARSTRSLQGVLAAARRGMRARDVGSVLLDERERLGIGFAALSFVPRGHQLKREAQRVLAAKSTRADDLLDAYFELWGGYGDINYNRSSAGEREKERVAA